MKYDISKNKIKLHTLSLDNIGDLKAIMDEEFSKKRKVLILFNTFNISMLSIIFEGKRN